MIAVAIAVPVAIDANAQTADLELIERGVQLRRQGRDAEALEQFQRALELRPTARAKAQVALAEQALARWVEAERDLTDALEQLDDGWIGKNRILLERSLSVVREHLGTVRLVCSTDGAIVTANGMSAGTVPVEAIRVAAGNVLIEVEAPGYARKRLTLAVPPGAVVEQRVDLEPVPGTNIAPSEREALPTSQRRVQVEPLATAAPTAGYTSRRTLAWTVAGCAGVLLAEAVVAHLARERMVSKYDDDSICDVPGRLRSEVCAGYREGAETAHTLAIAGYTGGGLMAIAAVYLFATAQSRPSNGVRISVDRGLMVGYSGHW